ncbi:hypothetical protein Acr_20g0000530 [Actinidia rufa]|uniref:Uncharacterized protein n=1 Tax=Actinidia rufa TaxID=165716 RepID=A0A7J0GBQ5_9ERIC|nr:hypothetical protein Acr_20g0000530 [Actinidia rufa]
MWQRSSEANATAIKCQRATARSNGDQACNSEAYLRSGEDFRRSQSGDEACWRSSKQRRSLLKVWQAMGKHV